MWRNQPPSIAHDRSLPAHLIPCSLRVADTRTQTCTYARTHREIDFLCLRVCNRRRDARPANITHVATGTLSIKPIIHVGTSAPYFMHKNFHTENSPLNSQELPEVNELFSVPAMKITRIRSRLVPPKDAYAIVIDYFFCVRPCCSRPAKHIIISLESCHVSITCTEGAVLEVPFRRVRTFPTSRHVHQNNTYIYNFIAKM